MNCVLLIYRLKVITIYVRHATEREIERDLIIYFYIIDMNITDELRQLEMFMVDEFQKGFKCDDLYELVQYSSAIIPRL